jgi:hypothetical protein
LRAPGKAPIFPGAGLCPGAEALIFGPIVFPLFALVHLALAGIALGAWSAAPAAAAGLALVELITFFDNAVVASGNRLSIGSLCKRLNRARFSCMPCSSRA